jgi:hypothetical protein
MSVCFCVTFEVNTPCTTLHSAPHHIQSQLQQPQPPNSTISITPPELIDPLLALSIPSMEDRALSAIVPPHSGSTLLSLMPASLMGSIKEAMLTTPTPTPEPDATDSSLPDNGDASVGV